MNSSLKKYAEEICLLILSLCVIHCGSGDTLGISSDSPAADGSAFMTLTEFDTTHALITADLSHAALASHLSACLDLNITGTTANTSEQTAISTASVTIWDYETFGAIALDLDGGNYTANTNDQIAEVIITSDIFSFTQPITVELNANDCGQTGTALFQIAETLN